MGIITSLLGIVCILYYIAGVRYAGYRVSGLWIWLAAGIGWMVWGGCRIGCAVAGVPFFVPGALVAIVRVCLLAGLVLFFYLEHQIGTGMRAKGIENLDYIVVLGCQVKGTKPSKALKDRLDTAKEYMQANPETIAVLSGGQGKMEEISEAECMRRYLEKAGISRERLILEQRSTTTRQNLRYSRRYMDYLCIHCPSRTDLPSVRFLTDLYTQFPEPAPDTTGHRLQYASSIPLQTAVFSL